MNKLIEKFYETKQIEKTFDQFLALGYNLFLTPEEVIFQIAEGLEKGQIAISGIGKSGKSIGYYKTFKNI